MQSILWLIPALPLVGFVVNGTIGRRLPPQVVAVIGSLGPILSFLISLVVISTVHEGHGPVATYWQWMTTGDVDIGFGLAVDGLTSVMLLIVNGIGSLIHIYSYGYMREDAGIHRFFAYLNLFMTSMLLLVMGDSLPLLFVGWEGVGLCSYLLIGFWHTDYANVDAGRKAFIANRVGDFAFLIGMFVLFGLAGTLQFSGLQVELAKLQGVIAEGAFAGWAVPSVLTLAGLCLFIGATGKSAQIPLYVWLPDAMAGPTPVSALIHAATMVTAGVYMVGRLNFMFVGLDGLMTLIGFVGAATAIFSGAIAFAQYDIKKVLAYSTVSQLGFMFCGMASTFFSTGLFHVMTHAFFKALLFLGSGAVIMAMHHEQDIRKMGGLWKDLKLVAILFLIGSLALSGFPLTSGFFSKDEILGSVLARAQVDGGIWYLTFVLLMITAVMTAFYTTRLFVLTFLGKPADEHRHVHPVHPTMYFALIVLAILSLVGGAFGGWLEEFTHGNFVAAEWHHVHEHEIESAHTMAMVMSIIGALSGIGAAGFVYLLQPGLIDAWLKSPPGALLFRMAENKFYIDEIYDALFVTPITWAAQLLWGVVDRILIDWLLVEGAGRGALAVGSVFRRAQSGPINVSNGAMVVGALAILIFLLLGVANG